MVALVNPNFVYVSPLLPFQTQIIFSSGLSLATSIVLSLGLPCGLLVAGWSAEKGVHWIVTDIVSYQPAWREPSEAHLCLYLGAFPDWSRNRCSIPSNADLYR